MSAKIENFFRNHPVFTRESFEQAMGYVEKKNTGKNVLAHHIQQGHIVRIRRGLFAAIPYGADAVTYPINPYLVANALADDAVIAYHTALTFYGVAYSSIYRFVYLTQSKPRVLEFRDINYQSALFPATLISKKKTHCYINKEDVQGIDILITSKERTLVDVMDRPLLGGGWEEIWRSLDMMQRFNIEDIVDYALILENSTTIAKVGFYLEQRKEELNLDEQYLLVLQQHRPASPHYIDGARKVKCKYIKRWNLMIPESIINRDWEEELQWESKI